MTSSLKTRRQFALVYEQGKKAVGRYLVVFAWNPPAEFDAPQARDLLVGIVASRRVGNAIRRNRAKRLLRVAFQHHRDRLPPLWIALVARSASADTDVKSYDVSRELESLLVRLDLMHDA